MLTGSTSRGVVVAGPLGLLLVLGACSSREDVLSDGPGTSTAANQPSAAGFAGESCPGCARFDVPLSAPDQLATFELGLAEPADMTDGSVTWRLMALGFMGTSGAVSPFARDAQGRERCLDWTDLSALDAWADVTCVPSEDAGATGAFDASRVVALGVRIRAGSGEPGAVYDTALVYLDAITFSDPALMDLRFDSGIGDLGLVQGEGAAPPGSSVAFLGP